LDISALGCNAAFRQRALLILRQRRAPETNQVAFKFACSPQIRVYARLGRTAAANGGQPAVVGQIFMHAGQLAICVGLSVGVVVNPDRRRACQHRTTIISLFIARNAGTDRRTRGGRASEVSRGRCVYLTDVSLSFDPANNRRQTGRPAADDDPSSAAVVNSACQLVASPRGAGPPGLTTRPGRPAVRRENAAAARN